MSALDSSPIETVISAEFESSVIDGSSRLVAIFQDWRNASTVPEMWTFFDIILPLDSRLGLDLQPRKSGSGNP